MRSALARSGCALTRKLPQPGRRRTLASGEGERAGVVQAGRAWLRRWQGTWPGADRDGDGVVGVEPADLAFQVGLALGGRVAAGVEVLAKVAVGRPGPQDGVGDLEEGVRDRHDGLLLRSRALGPAEAADQLVVTRLDIVDVSVALCASDRGHPVVTNDPDDIAAIDPALMLIRPTGV